MLIWNMFPLMKMILPSHSSTMVISGGKQIHASSRSIIKTIIKLNVTIVAHSCWLKLVKKVRIRLNLLLLMKKRKKLKSKS